MTEQSRLLECLLENDESDESGEVDATGSSLAAVTVGGQGPWIEPAARVRVSMPKGMQLPIGRKVHVQLRTTEDAALVVLHLAPNGIDILHRGPWRAGHGAVPGYVEGEHGERRRFEALAATDHEVLNGLMTCGIDCLADEWLAAEARIAPMARQRACSVKFPYVCVDASLVDELRRTASAEPSRLWDRCIDELSNRRDHAKSACGIVAESVKVPSHVWADSTAHPEHGVFLRLLRTELGRIARKRRRQAHNEEIANLIDDALGRFWETARQPLYERFVSRCEIEGGSTFEVVHYLSLRGYLETIVKRLLWTKTRHAARELEKAFLRNMRKPLASISGEEVADLLSWSNEEVLESPTERTIVELSTAGLKPREILAEHRDIRYDLAKHGGGVRLLKNVRDTLLRRILRQARDRGPEAMQKTLDKLCKQ